MKVPADRDLTRHRRGRVVQGRQGSENPEGLVQNPVHVMNVQQLREEKQDGRQPEASGDVTGIS